MFYLILKLSYSNYVNIYFKLNDIKIIDQQNFQQSFAFRIGANGKYWIYVYTE